MGEHADDALNYFTRKQFGFDVIETTKRRPKKEKANGFEKTHKGNR
jgi:hypothetical protein